MLRAIIDGRGNFMRLVTGSALYLGFLFLLTLSPAAQANHDSIFNQLQEMFETGSLPEQGDLVGWRSGRCYHAEQPSTPFNGLLAGWLTSGPDNGPIGPNKDFLHTLPVFWRNGAPNIFDEPTKEVEAKVTRFIDSQRPSVATVENYRGSAYGSYRHSPDTPWVMRKNQDYILLQMTQNGYVAQICYYFKLVHN